MIYNAISCSSSQEDFPLKKLVKKNMFFYLEDKKRKNQAPV